MPRTTKVKDLAKAEEKLQALGLDTAKFRARSRSRGLKRGRSEADEDAPVVSRSKSRNRSKSVVPGEGYKNVKAKEKAVKIQHMQSYRKIRKFAKKGETDNVVLNKMPKHLFSGKRGIGKTDRR